MNRKITLAVVIVAVLAAAYPASSWYFGQQIEARARRLNEEQFAALPFLKLVRHDYERGIFSAEETVVAEIRIPQPKSGDAPDAALLRVTAKSAIRHGPVLDSGDFGMASITSTIEFDDAIQKKVQEAFAGKPPLETRMWFDFGGGGRFVFTSPKFSVVLPGKAEDETVTFSGDGMDLSGDFTSRMERYTMRGNAPRFELKANDGPVIKFAGFTVEADQQRLFPDDMLSYVGTQRFSLAALEVEPGQAGDKGKPPRIVLKDIKYDTQVSPSGDFIDLVMRLGAASLTVGEQDYGPAAYDSSMKHLRARSLLTLNRKFLELYSQPDLLNDQNRVLQALEPMKGEIVDLLLDGLVLSVDRITFRLPDGEAKFTMSVKLDDAKAEDFDNPLALIGKVDASADVALPSGLFKMLPQAAREEESDEESEGEEEEAQQGFIDGMIAKFVQQGYVTDESGILKSRIVFKAGKLLLNDKPFNPMLMLQ